MRIKGGLGNQLFQYAMAYALSKKMDQPFLFNPAFTSNMTPRAYKLPHLQVESDQVIKDSDLSWKITLLKNRYLNRACKIMGLFCHRCGDTLYWIENLEKFEIPGLSSPKFTYLYLDGYFQSELYFKEYRRDLLSQIRPNYKAEEEYLEKLELISQSNSVAVHVRRGDFKKDRSPAHYLLDEAYYKEALSFMRGKLDNPEFFWFSDDIEWVKENIGFSDDFRFVNIKTTHGDIDDMMLMKNCKHIITANSTFSWWAAWLNEHENAIKCVPQKPFGIKEMIPESWVKI